MAWKDRLRRGYSALFRAGASRESRRRRPIPLAVEGIEDRVAPVALTLIAPPLYR